MEAAQEGIPAWLSAVRFSMVEYVPATPGFPRKGNVRNLRGEGLCGEVPLESTGYMLLTA